jgi:hypothetical protein
MMGGFGYDFGRRVALGKVEAHFVIWPALVARGTAHSTHCVLSYEIFLMMSILSICICVALVALY